MREYGQGYLEQMYEDWHSEVEGNLLEVQGEAKGNSSQSIVTLLCQSHRQDEQTQAHAVVSATGKLGISKT